MNSADTADQMMKMTLEGIQVAAEIGLKAGGTAAKSLAVTLYAIITDNKKIKGKTNLDNLLKSNKELKVFAIHHSDLKKFCEEAKHYGVLYSVLKEKNIANTFNSLLDFNRLYRFFFPLIFLLSLIIAYKVTARDLAAVPPAFNPISAAT